MYRERGTGRRRELELGASKGPSRSGLTLAEARTKAADARKMLAVGKDPKSEREVERGSDETFGSFADAHLKTILPGLKGRSAEADWAPAHPGAMQANQLKAARGHHAHKSTFWLSCRRCG